MEARGWRHTGLGRRLKGGCVVVGRGRPMSWLQIAVRVAEAAVARFARVKFRIYLQIIVCVCL